MANDVYSLSILGLAEKQAWESVLHFESTVANASDPLTKAEHLVDAFNTAVLDALSECMGTDTEITGYKAKRVNNTGGPQYLAPIAAVGGDFGTVCVVGSIGGVILSYYTQGTKTRTGRWFLPGFPSEVYDDGVFAAGFKTKVAALITALTGTLTASGASFHFGVWAAKTTTFYAPSIVKLSGHLGTQRRRLLPLI